jgi:DNA-directed RNA polymerase specialized sigma24 family protein
MESNSRQEQAAPEIIAEVLARTRPDLEKLLQRHWVSEKEADDLLDEALLSLLMRWDRIIEPSLWLLRTVDRAIQRRLLIPLFQ